ncbi:hypothetical protein N431DRAFT_505432, partial [Stipitochalara longipes BDJ]
RRRVRAYHHKTRTGCSICKIRRLKCDETKPECLRCVRYWGHCEGYAQPRKWVDSTSENRECMPVLRPKSRLAQASTSFPLLYHSFERSRQYRFRNDEEQCAFFAFQHLTTNELSGLFVSALWDSIILQESNEEEFVRDAITAIGALSSSEKRTVNDPVHGRLTNFTPTSRYQFALQQYGRAVKTMRESLTGTENNLRKALISCLLVICFESLQGNYSGAIAHSVSGCALLQGWLDSTNKKSSDTLEASLRKDGIASPAKNVVEDKLVQAFARLDLQLMGFWDPRPPAMHQNLLAEGQSTVDNMPKTFISIDEARLYLELIQRRNARLMVVFAAHRASNRDFKGVASLDFGIGEGPFNFYPRANFSVSIEEPGHPNFWPAGYQRMTDLGRWFAAFEPLYASLHRHTRSWTSASTLKMQAQGAKLSFIAATFSDACSIDRFLPDFRAMVDLGSEISKDRLFSGQNVFCFEPGILSSLRLVVSVNYAGSLKSGEMQLHL